MKYNYIYQILKKTINEDLKIILILQLYKCIKIKM